MVKNDIPTEELSEEEKERTKRQKLIQGWNQQIIKGSTVFIAGVGALGCEIAKDLALSGIGKLILCDMDTIETSNLSRQMLFYKGDEGRFKAEVAAERLQKMNPFMKTEIFTIPLQKIPMEVYQECQVVVAALDNVQARMDLNKFCLKLGIPLVEGGTVGFEGHVQIIIPESTKTQNSQPFPVYSEEKIIEDIFQAKLWNLEEKDFPDYFHAQKKIRELEEEIDQLKEINIIPVEQELRNRAKQEFQQLDDPSIYSTPCYRCVVPIPPPLQNQVAACTLKGIPRTREHCAIRGEVQFIKKFERKPDYDNAEDMKETLTFAQTELEQLRARVLEESIPPEQKEKISVDDLNELKSNIFNTFGGNFELDDMENILGNKIPAIQSVSSIISSIQSQEILKILFILQNEPVGPIMNPPYLNYNGKYGLFESLEISRLEDCVACGSRQGQENLTVAVPQDARIRDIFRAVQDFHPSVQLEKFIITNPLTKQFLYNPLFPQGKTEDKTLEEMQIHHYDEIVFTQIGKSIEMPENPDSNSEKPSSIIKQYNVTVQII